MGVAHAVRSANRHRLVPRMRRRARVAPSLGVDVPATLQRERPIGARAGSASPPPNLHGGIRLGRK
eukprot:2854522-Heterocapsa_arctica.AAC.1